MCLYVKGKNGQETFRSKENVLAQKRVAKRDIVVYKWLEQGNMSPFRGFHFTVNRLYKIKSLRISTYKSCEYHVGDVSRGFHAYTKRIKNRITCKGLIPKGSEYVLGVGNQIVSNQFILLENFD